MTPDTNRHQIPIIYDHRYDEHIFDSAIHSKCVDLVLASQYKLPHQNGVFLQAPLDSVVRYMDQTQCKGVLVCHICLASGTWGPIQVLDCSLENLKKQLVK